MRDITYIIEKMIFTIIWIVIGCGCIYMVESLNKPQPQPTYNMNVKGDTVFVDGKKYKLVEVKGYILEEVKEK